MTRVRRVLWWVLLGWSSTVTAWAEPSASERRLLERVDQELARGESKRALRQIARVITGKQGASPELWLRYAELRAACASDKPIRLSASDISTSARVWEQLPALLEGQSLDENRALRLTLLHWGVFLAASDAAPKALEVMEPGLRRGEVASVDCLRQVAAQAVAHQRLNDAHAALSRARALMPEHHQLPRELGLVLLAQGRADASIPEFEAALEAEPQSLEVRRDLAYALASAGRAQEGFAALAGDAARCREAPGCLLELTRWGFEAGRLDEAREHARALTQADPRNVDAWLLLGEITSQKRDLEEAKRAYSEVLKLAPNQVRAREALKGLSP
ncbi:MAG: tetratricopeptide repeat protein [Myxococcales bacterium]